MSPEHLYILCHRYYDLDGKLPAIGGVETYIHCLSQLMLRQGWQVTILQFGHAPLEKMLDSGCRLVLTTGLKHAELVLRQMMSERPGVVVYSDVACVPPRMEHPCIMLQHGIGWDYVHLPASSSLMFRLKSIKYAFAIRRLFGAIVRYASTADCVICVDTMFRNWLQIHSPTKGIWGANMRYIPNFAPLPDPRQLLPRWDGRPIRCICPRRFCFQRGVPVFGRVVRELAQEFPKVNFAFIGEGPSEPGIRSLLHGLSNVSIYARSYEQMEAEYLQAHLTVVPTLASEGTSLSCIEAMASGCAVLATTVGGLGNLVLPGFNGEFCQPSYDDLLTSTRRLLASPARLRQLGDQARTTVEQSFSLQLWEERILDAIAFAQRRCASPQSSYLEPDVG